MISVSDSKKGMYNSSPVRTSIMNAITVTRVDPKTPQTDMNTTYRI